MTIRFLDPAAARVPARPRRRTSRSWPRSWASPSEQLKDGHRQPARVQPDDGPPRLPSGCHLSGDRRDADHRRHQRRHQGQQGAPATTSCREIMIPLVGEVKELKFVKDVVVATADRLIEEAGVDMKYHVGTMIEIPRAALTADEIATEAEFFSFGTNDLTQMTFGFSRDDAGKFLDCLLRQQDLRVRSVRHAGPEGRRQAGGDGRRAGPRHPSGHQAGHLRRARRRSRLRRVLPQGRPELCLLLARSVCPSPAWLLRRLPSANSANKKLTQ